MQLLLLSWLVGWLVGGSLALLRFNSRWLLNCLCLCEMAPPLRIFSFFYHKQNKRRSLVSDPIRVFVLLHLIFILIFPQETPRSSTNCIYKNRTSGTKMNLFSLSLPRCCLCSIIFFLFFYSILILIWWKKLELGHGYFYRTRIIYFVKCNKNTPPIKLNRN